MAQNVSERGSVSGLPVLAVGACSIVYQVSESAVMKGPGGSQDDRQNLATELDIYQRLGPHPSIPRVFAVRDDMLVLERLRHPLRMRLREIYEAGFLPAPTQILQWAIQITRGFSYFQKCGVLQVDVGLHNVFLDVADSAKICDFAGSSIDGSIPYKQPSPRARHPKILTPQPSVLSELFAIGSLLYELETTHQPYPEKEEAEVERLFIEDQFPDTNTLLLGAVITKCWMRGYEDAGQVLSDLEHIRDSLKHA